MKRMEPASNRSAPNPGSSPRSEDSVFQAPLRSQGAYYPRPLAVETLNQALPSVRDEDLARWGAYTLEDIGVIEVDRLVGLPSEFGRRIRDEICCSGGGLNERWTEIASRLHVHSPGTTNPTALLAAICNMATALLFVEGRINAAA